MVEGNGAPVLNLKDELEKLCDYGSLGRQKVIARLSHLVSEVSFVQEIRWSDIERIPNSGEEGCGYIPEGEFSSQVICCSKLCFIQHHSIAGFFRDIPGCPYKTSDAIQIRILSPKM
jgi:hypothetical protein